MTVCIHTTRKRVNYVPVRTNAPESCDGFQTVSFIEESNGWRIALVPHDQVEWQCGKYNANFESKVLTGVSAEEVEDEVWDRFMSALGAAE